MLHTACTLAVLQTACPLPELYVDYVAGRGIDLFAAACHEGLEGIVAKRTNGL